MTNSSNAFATVRPVQTSMSDMAKEVGDLGFRYREENRIEDEIARLQKEREAKAQKELEDSYTPIKKSGASGIKSLDDAAIGFYNHGTEMNFEIYKKELAGKPLTPEERALKKNLANLGDDIAFMSKSYMDNDKQYEADVKAGVRKRIPSYDLMKQKLPENARAFLDKKGRPVIAIDNDGDGKPEFITYDPNKGLNLDIPNVPNVRVDTIVEGIAKTLKESKTVTDKNFVKRTVAGAPEDAVKIAAKDAVYDGDKPSALAISHFWDNGIKDPSQITPEQMAGFQAEMETRIRRSVASTNETDVDYGAINATQRLAHDKKKDEPVKPTFQQTENPPIFVKKGVKTAPGYRTVAISNSKPVPIIQGIAKDGSLKEITNATVGSYTVVMEGGVRKIVAEVVYQDSKSSTLSADEQLVLSAPETSENRAAKELVMTKVNKGAENKYEVLTLQEKDGAKYAQQLGFEDFNEMKDQAKSNKTQKSSEAEQYGL